MFKSLVFLLLLCVPVFAFEQTDQPSGTISRPGARNLLTNNHPLSVSTTGNNSLAVNKIANSPRAMSVAYQSHLKPTQALDFSRDFITNNPGVIKVKPTDFALMSSNLVLNKFYFINLKQTYKGTDIWGAHLGIRATPQGKVFFTGGEVFPNIDINETPSISVGQAKMAAISGISFDSQADRIKFDKMAILPLIFADKIDYRLCYVFTIDATNPRIDWRTFVDAYSGEVIWRENTINYLNISGMVTGYYLPATPYETPEYGGFRNENIYADEQVSDTSEISGHFHFNVGNAGPFNIDLYLRGPYFRILDQLVPNAGYSVAANAGDSVNIEWNDDDSAMPQRNAFYHGQIVHDFIKTLDPNFIGMDFQMICRVNVDGTCNAFYSQSDRSLNFYRDGGGCPNIALIGDVVYHEYGHGVTNMQYMAGGSDNPNDAMNEGFSDFLAGIITNQPRIGRGFTGPGTYLRSIDNNRRYPDNWNGESHNDGLIISGALWDLRQMLASRPGYVDSLWQYGKYGYGLDFESFFWDVLTLDDDDGNINNGTPHAYEIYHAFGDLHGIGPGIQVQVNHVPLTDSEDSTSSFTVLAEAISLNSFSTGSVAIHYSTGAEFHQVNMANIGGNNWSGQIPRQNFGTTVRYYLEAIDNLGFVGKSPSTAPDSLYSFYVGYDAVGPTMNLVSSPRNTVNLFGPYGPFVIGATDVHGIESGSATFHYKVNNENEATLIMRADTLPGQSILDSMVVNHPLLFGDTIHYWMSCRDGAYLHNVSRLPQNGDFTLVMSDSELVDDFEGGSLAGWQVDGAGWVWFDHLGYHSPYCMKSSLDNYLDNMHSLVYRTRPLNFTRYSHVWMKFAAKNVIAAGDTCFVVASRSQSGPWIQMGGISGASGWANKSFELTGFAGPGNENVYYGLLFSSDASVTSFGILIDNVSLTVEPLTGIDDNQLSLPNAVSLAQNYPNPFNLQTAIKFDVPKTTNVTLDVYDLLGRKVICLVNSNFNTGSHQVIWDGINSSGQIVTSGIYFYKLQVGQESHIRMMTLVK